MNEERGKKAFVINEQIVANEEKRRELMSENAMLLSAIYEDKLYQELLGDDEAPWAGYLGQIEIYYSRSRINYLIRIYRRYSIELGIDKSVWVQVPITRLMDILHVVNEANFEEWISKALVLTTRDWNIEVRKAKGLITEEDDHKHDMVTYDICSQCGRKEKHTHDSSPETVK